MRSNRQGRHHSTSGPDLFLDTHPGCGRVLVAALFGLLPARGVPSGAWPLISRSSTSGMSFGQSLATSHVWPKFAVTGQCLELHRTNFEL